MRKLFKSAFTLLLAAGLAGAGHAAQAQVKNSPRVLRVPVDTDTPDTTTGTPYLAQLTIFPNPVYGSSCQISAPASGVMVLSAYPLSGPSAGQAMPFAIDPYYVAGTQKLIVLPSYLYSASYLISGRVGDSFYSQRIEIRR